MNVGDIKTVLWSDAADKKCGEFIPPPLALRRDPKMIREFFRSGLKQKLELCEKYASFDNDNYLMSLYGPGEIEDNIIEDGNMWGDSDEDCIIEYGVVKNTHPCAGLTIVGIMASSHLDDARKETVSFGYKHIVREGFVAKANLFRPESFRWDSTLWGGADGVVASGIGPSTRPSNSRA